MPIKFYNPTSAGRRAGSVIDYNAVLTTEQAGEVADQGQAAGERPQPPRRYHRPSTAVAATSGCTASSTSSGTPRTVSRQPLCTIEYDPNRSCFIALVEYADGDQVVHPRPQRLEGGYDGRQRSRFSPPEVGNCVPLANIPGGLEVHNIEMNPGQGGKLVRSAGGVARLSAKEGEWAVIILPSGEMRRIKSKCRATIGQLGNLDHGNVSIGKAGRSAATWGFVPHTRAKAMNPIDHPLGGGEGRSNGGRHPVSKTGVPAKGGITRRPRKNSDKLILRRRKFGKFQQRPQTVSK